MLLQTWTFPLHSTAFSGGEPAKYGGRDADPEKPIVMGK